MRKLQNFKCEGEGCELIQERLVEDSITTVECTECGSKSNKMLSLPRYLSNTTGKSPARN